MDQIFYRLHRNRTSKRYRHKHPEYQQPVPASVDQTDKIIRINLIMYQEHISRVFSQKTQDSGNDRYTDQQIPGQCRKTECKDTVHDSKIVVVRSERYADQKNPRFHQTFYGFSVPTLFAYPVQFLKKLSFLTTGSQKYRKQIKGIRIGCIEQKQNTKGYCSLFHL